MSCIVPTDQQLICWAPAVLDSQYSNTERCLELSRNGHISSYFRLVNYWNKCEYNNNNTSLIKLLRLTDTEFIIYTGAYIHVYNIHTWICMYIHVLIDGQKLNSKFSPSCSPETPTDYLQEIKAKFQQTHLRFGNFLSKDWSVVYSYTLVGYHTSHNTTELPATSPRGLPFGNPPSGPSWWFGARQWHCFFLEPSSIVKCSRTIMHWHIPYTSIYIPYTDHMHVQYIHLHTIYIHIPF